MKSYDLITTDGQRIQVKARILRNPTKVGERQLSPFRSFEFDHALVVLFDREYQVIRATLLPASVILEHSRESKHVNGRICIARDTLLDLGADVTPELADANN